MDKTLLALVIITVILVLIFGCMIVWFTVHNSNDYTKPCILAGYDRADWKMFAPEPVCIKEVPFSKAVGQ